MKTIREVGNFVEKVLDGLPKGVADFRRHRLNASEATRSAKKMLTFYQPLLDQHDWQGDTDGMDGRFRRRYEHQAKLAACQDITNHINAAGLTGLKQEAAQAGVDLPVFTRQLLMTITRAYAQIFAIQLFGLYPLSQPTGRIHYRDYLYDSNFTGSSPNISAGDRTDDTTKFNTDFYSTPELQAANKLRYKYTSQTISTGDWRIATEWSDQFADDAASVYGDDAQGLINAHMVQEMSRTVDRRLVARLIADMPGANSVTWDSTDGGAYTGYTPDQKLAYDENLVRDGINLAVKKIADARKYGNDAYPEWGLCGSNFAYRLTRLRGFTASPMNQGKEVDQQSGAMRDLGVLTSSGIRFLVDPLLSTDVCLLGRKPRQRGAVGIWWAPYIMAQPTRDYYDPIIGETTNAIRARDAIVGYDSSVPASSQLMDVYGKITVT